MSRAADGKVLFGEFLPDLPPTDNPGLTEALNVLPVDKFYAAYKPLTGITAALSERPRGGIGALDSAGNAYFYAGTATALHQRNGAAWTDKTDTAYTTASDDYWRFVQFDSWIIGTNYAEVPQALPVGDGGDFDDLALVGTAPNARQVGIVGRHLVLGDTVDGVNGIVPHRIQWSRIDDPTEWPVPNSTDARNKQSGEQFMPSAFGPVTGIVGNDQFGIVFQHAGISRMTYVGGDLVYQFDVIDSTRGAAYPNAIVEVGKLAYFIASDGFFVTDGVKVEPIGASKFDRLFLESVDTGYKGRVYGALDKARNLIYWTYPGVGSSAGVPNSLIIYNYREGRATRASDVVECLVGGLTTAVPLESIDNYFASIDDVVPSLDSPFWKGGNDSLLGFTPAHELGVFAGSPGTAVIEGQEAELSPGLYSYISGVRPMVQGQAAVTVSLGTRNGYADSVVYGAPMALHPRTGCADFRVETRLVRARVNISGAFPAAQGLMYQAQASGAA